MGRIAASTFAEVTLPLLIIGVCAAGSAILIAIRMRRKRRSDPAVSDAPPEEAPAQEVARPTAAATPGPSNETE